MSQAKVPAEAAKATAVRMRRTGARFMRRRVWGGGGRVKRSRFLLPLGEGGAQRRMRVGRVKRRSRPRTVDPHPFAPERRLRRRALKPSPIGRGSSRPREVFPVFVGRADMGCHLCQERSLIAWPE